MAFKNFILILYGSLNSVPSPEGMAPAKIIYDTAEALKNKYYIKVLSHYHEKLKHIVYDLNVFKHTNINWFDKLLLLLVKLFMPYSKRKELFVTGNDKSLLYYISVCRWLFLNRPAVVVVHVSTGLALVIKKVFPKIPILYYHHGTSLHTKLNDRQWSKLVNGSTKGIISVNKISLELANQTFRDKLPAHKGFAIYNGINPLANHNDFSTLKSEGRKLLNISDHDFVFMFVGRFSREKGILNLLHAFQSIVQEKKGDGRRHLVIVGGAGGIGMVDAETEFMKECQAFVQSHRLPVHFTGFLHGASLTKVIAAADVGLLTTDRALSLEGHPLAIIEFFALGKPVIATAVGGIPEVIKDGVNGFVLDEYPFEQQLCEKMHLLFDTPDLAKTMGEAAYRSFLEDFTIEKMATSVEKVLFQIQSQNHNPACVE